MEFVQATAAVRLTANRAALQPSTTRQGMSASSSVRRSGGSAASTVRTHSSSVTFASAVPRQKCRPAPKTSSFGVFGWVKRSGSKWSGAGHAVASRLAAVRRASPACGVSHDAAARDSVRSFRPARTSGPPRSSQARHR